MFKNLKQKLENLSANSPPSKTTSLDQRRDSFEHHQDDGALQTTSTVENKFNEGKSSSETISEEKSEVTLSVEGQKDSSQLAEGQNSASQSDPSKRDIEVSDWSVISKEELIERHLKLIKANDAHKTETKDFVNQKDEISRKMRRRTNELEEQIQLDRQAKRDLENNYALMLDEKDELITVLKTQVQLLKSNQSSITTSSAAASEQQTAASEATEPPISLEEVVILKDKVRRLESLLTKCKDTIKSNKERARQFIQEKEDLVKANEERVKELQLKHDKELKSKVSDLQEEIAALSQVRADLNSQLVQLTNQVSEKNKVIQVSEEKFKVELEKVKREMEETAKSLKSHEGLKEEPQISAENIDEEATATSKDDAAATETTEATVATTQVSEATEAATVNAAEYEKLKKLFDLRSKELIQVLEERTKLRKELASQRQRFATVLERYDEQMKVVQDELKERMKPGPIESTLTQEVRTILKINPDSTNETEKPITMESRDKKDSETANEGKEKTDKVGTFFLEALPKKAASESVTDGSSKPAMVPREELEASEAKIAEILVLLERCAKQIDSRDAIDCRWKERLAEAENKAAVQLRESHEIITRLNNQIMELTNRENLLNANLERARQESDDILLQQRAEMSNLQSMVEDLLSREQQLRGQMQKTKLMCDAEVARVNAENTESIQHLTNMFEETQTAVSELSGQLLESKEQSDLMINALGKELDEKCQMLQATADFIEITGDNKIKSQFMKIIVDCGSGVCALDEIGDITVKMADKMVKTGELPDHNGADEVQTLPVKPVDCNKAIHDASNNNGGGGENVNVMTSNDLKISGEPFVGENVSVENCKLTVLSDQDRKEVEITSLDQREIFNFEIHLIDTKPSNKESAKDSSSSDLLEESKKPHAQNLSNPNACLIGANESSGAVIAKLFSRRTADSGSPKGSQVKDLLRGLMGEDSDSSSEERHLKREIQKYKISLAKLQQKCKELESQNVALVENCQVYLNKCTHVEKDHSDLQQKLKTVLANQESGRKPQEESKESPLREKDEEILGLEARVKELMEKLECSELVITRLQETNSRLVEAVEKISGKMAIFQESEKLISVKLSENELELNEMSSIIEDFSKKEAELIELRSELKRINSQLDESLKEKDGVAQELEKLKKSSDMQHNKLLELEEISKNYDLIRSKMDESSGKEKDAFQKENLQLKARVEESESRLKDFEILRSKLAKSELDYKEMEQKRCDAQAELEKVKGELIKEKERSCCLEDETKTYHQDKLGLWESMTKIKENLTSVELENVSLKETLNNSEVKLTESNKKTDELNDEFEKIKKHSADDKSQIIFLEGQLKDYNEIKSEIGKFKDLLHGQEMTNDDLNTKVDNFAREKENLITKKEKIESELEDLQSENERLQKTIAELNEKIKSLVSEKSTLTEKLGVKNLELHGFNANKEDGLQENLLLKKKIEECEKNATELGTTNTQILKELEANYEIIKTLEEIVTISNTKISNRNALLEDKEVLISEKNRIIKACKDTLGDTQILLKKLSNELVSSRENAKTLATENSELTERWNTEMEDKDGIIASLQVELETARNQQSLVARGEAEKSSNNETSKMNRKEEESLVESKIVESSQEMVSQITEDLYEVKKDLKEKPEFEQVMSESREREKSFMEEIVQLKTMLDSKSYEINDLISKQEGLVQRLEEAELNQRKRHVYYDNDIKDGSAESGGTHNHHEMGDVAVDRDLMDDDVLTNKDLISINKSCKDGSLSIAMENSRPACMSSDTKHMELLEKEADNFNLLLAADEMSSQIVEVKIEKTKLHYQEKPASSPKSIRTPRLPEINVTVSLDERQNLLAKIERLKKLNESNEQELSRIRGFLVTDRSSMQIHPLDTEGRDFSMRGHVFDKKEFLKETTNPKLELEHSRTRRDHFDSLDLSRELFSTPEKQPVSGKSALMCVDDHLDYHRQTLIDLSPPICSTNEGNMLHARKIILEKGGTEYGVMESGNEKSDSDLLDVSDSRPPSYTQSHLKQPQDLEYAELHRQYYLLTNEVGKLKSELHFYYANSHQRHHLQQPQQQHQQQQQQFGDKHDSFLDLAEPTELEYLRNVLYKYMLGMETKTLAKVICTVVRFSEDQTKKIIEREDSRAFVFGPRKQ